MLIKIKKIILSIISVGLLLNIASYGLSENVPIEKNILDNVLTKYIQNLPNYEKVLYVGGSGPGNYSKIQEAIENASNGDTIYVYSGTYNEHVSIDKSIKLLGESQDSTIINSGIISYKINAITVKGFTIKDSVEILEGSDITISENKILDNNNDSSAKGIGMCSGTNNIISENSIINFRGNTNAVGIHIANLSDSEIIGNTFCNIQNGAKITMAMLGTDLSYCEIRENLITDINAHYFYGFLLSGSNISINDNTIKKIYCNGSHSFFLNGENIKATKNTIKDIDSNVGFVIGLEDSSYSILKDNIIKNISGFTWGIDLYGSSNNSIMRNTIEKTTIGIWLIDSHYNMIDNNDVIECKQIITIPQTGIGLYLVESTYNSITNNTFKDNFKDATFDFEHICSKDEPFYEYKKNRSIPNSFNRSKKDFSNTWNKNFWNQPQIRPKTIYGTLTVCNNDYTDYYSKILENYDNNPKLKSCDLSQVNRLSRQKNFLRTLNQIVIKFYHKFNCLFN